MWIGVICIIVKIIFKIKLFINVIILDIIVYLNFFKYILMLFVNIEKLGIYFFFFFYKKRMSIFYFFIFIF